MLLIVEKGIRGGIYHAIHWYAKANNKYIKNYDKNKESSYLKYDEEHNKGYILEINIQYSEKLHKLYNDLPFLPERIKIGKVETLVTN